MNLVIDITQPARAPHFRMPHIYHHTCGLMARLNQEIYWKVAARPLKNRSRFVDWLLRITSRPAPRFMLTDDCPLIKAQTYRCERCGTALHVDTDWFD